METILLQNQILIMESNLTILELNSFDKELKEKLKEQIMFSKQYLKNIV
jgi:hypothetical protein